MNTSRTTFPTPSSNCSMPHTCPISSNATLTPPRCSDSCGPPDNSARSTAMDDKERYQRGAAVRRKVLGNTWVDRSEANQTAFNADWLDFITRCAWGEVWTRPHFDARTRRILVIGTMMAPGRWGE